MPRHINCDMFNQKYHFILRISFYRQINMAFQTQTIWPLTIFFTVRFHLNQTSGIIFNRHTRLYSPCCCSSRICRMAARIIFLSSYSPAARSFIQSHKMSAHKGQACSGGHHMWWCLSVNTHHLSELIDVLDWLQFSWQDVQVVAWFWPERDKSQTSDKQEIIVS